MPKVSGLVLMLFIPTVLLTAGPSIAATNSNNQGNINTQEVKDEYRAFLQQLKQLNSQYKEVTGQMAQVMKEEGVPSWDMGDTATTLTPEPGVTIKDSKKDLTVIIDLPGIKKDTLKIAVVDGQKLTVSANRKFETDVKRIEKTVMLPSTVNPTQGARASYEDGVLTIQLTKTSTQEVVIPVR